VGELDEVLCVGSVDGNDGIQPVEDEASMEEVHQREGPAAYLDLEAMDQEEDLTDHRDRMGADHRTWEVDRGHKSPLGGKLARAVWRLDIRL
jgi:ssDNA-binding replication factor A large subunit